MQKPHCRPFITPTNPPLDPEAGSANPTASPSASAAAQEAQLMRRVHRELIDDYDEELEMEREDWEQHDPEFPDRKLEHHADRD